MKNETIHWYYNGPLRNEEQDGHSIVNVNLIKHLITKGYTVIVNYIHFERDLETEKFLDNLGISSVNLIDKYKWHKRLASILFPKVTQKSRHHIVFGSNAVMDHMEKISKNTILIAGDVESRKWLQRKNASSFHNFIINKLREKSYRVFNKVIIYNNSELDYLSCNENIIVNPVCYNNLVQLSENQVKEYDIIFTGNFSYQPNKEAANYIINNFSNGPFKVALVGYHASELALSSREFIITKDSVPSIEEEIRKSRVYFSPLIFGTGVKNKILSAINCSLPIIATKISVEGIPNIENFPSIKIINDRTAVQSELIEIYDNYNFYSNSSMETKKFYDKEMSWNAFSNKIADILEKE